MSIIKKALLGIALAISVTTGASASPLGQPVALNWICDDADQAALIYQSLIASGGEPVRPTPEQVNTCRHAPGGLQYQGLVVDILAQFFVAERNAFTMLVEVVDLRKDVTPDARTYFTVIRYGAGGDERDS